MPEQSMSATSTLLGTNGESAHALLIHGERRPGRGDLLDIVNPATAKVFARCHSARCIW